MPLDMISTTSSTSSRGPIASAAMTSLEAFFQTSQHRPSAEHLAALASIANTMEAMADGWCEPVVHLSAVDPGIGKSQTVIHFARALVLSRAHSHVGMIICVGRITEARSLATALSDIRGSLAVLTSDLDVNALGDFDPDQAGNAQVLITTQQRIERATEGRAFGDVGAFRFAGEPRGVRVWDEAFLPGVVVTMSEDDLAFLLKPARSISPLFRAGLKAFCLELDGAANDQLIDIPDWTQTYGVTLPAFFDALQGGGLVRDDQRMAATGIFALAGRTARIWKDNDRGAAVLSY